MVLNQGVTNFLESLLNKDKDGGYTTDEGNFSSAAGAIRSDNASLNHTYPQNQDSYKFPTLASVERNLLKQHEEQLFQTSGKVNYWEDFPPAVNQGATYYRPPWEKQNKRYQRSGNPSTSHHKCITKNLMSTKANDSRFEVRNLNSPNSNDQMPVMRNTISTNDTEQKSVPDYMNLPIGAELKSVQRNLTFPVASDRNCVQINPIIPIGACHWKLIPTNAAGQNYNQINPILPYIDQNSNQIHQVFPIGSDQNSHQMYPILPIGFDQNSNRMHRILPVGNNQNSVQINPIFLFGPDQNSVQINPILPIGTDQNFSKINPILPIGIDQNSVHVNSPVGTGQNTHQWNSIPPNVNNQNSVDIKSPVGTGQNAQQRNQIPPNVNDQNSVQTNTIVQNSPKPVDKAEPLTSVMTKQEYEKHMWDIWNIPSPVFFGLPMIEDTEEVHDPFEVPEELRNRINRIIEADY